MHNSIFKGWKNKGELTNSLLTPLGVGFHNVARCNRSSHTHMATYALSPVRAERVRESVALAAGVDIDEFDNVCTLKLTCKQFDSAFTGIGFKQAFEVQLGSSYICLEFGDRIVTLRKHSLEFACMPNRRLRSRILSKLGAFLPLKQYPCFIRDVEIDLDSVLCSMLTDECGTSLQHGENYSTKKEIWRIVWEWVHESPHAQLSGWCFCEFSMSIRLRQRYFSVLSVHRSPPPNVTNVVQWTTTQICEILSVLSIAACLSFCRITYHINNNDWTTIDICNSKMRERVHRLFASMVPTEVTPEHNSILTDLLDSRFHTLGHVMQNHLNKWCTDIISVADACRV